MSRKKFQRIPKLYSIKCPRCGGISKRSPKETDCPQFFDCGKCGSRVITPVSSCCVICAYTDKKCPASLLMEARAKGLIVR